jgi:hypothetical protein
MPKKRYNAEEIIHKLREADVLQGQGRTVSQACKQVSYPCVRNGPNAPW